MKHPQLIDCHLAEPGRLDVVKSYCSGIAIVVTSKRGGGQAPALRSSGRLRKRRTNPRYVAWRGTGPRPTFIGMFVKTEDKPRPTFVPMVGETSRSRCGLWHLPSVAGDRPPPYVHRDVCEPSVEEDKLFYRSAGACPPRSFCEPSVVEDKPRLPLSSLTALLSIYS